MKGPVTTTGNRPSHLCPVSGAWISRPGSSVEPWGEPSSPWVKFQRLLDLQECRRLRSVSARTGLRQFDVLIPEHGLPDQLQAGRQQPADHLADGPWDHQELCAEVAFPLPNNLKER